MSGQTRPKREHPSAFCEERIGKNFKTIAMKNKSTAQRLPASDSRPSHGAGLSVKTIDVCAPQRAKLGEGAFWDERTQKLYWVDILDGRLFVYDPALNRNEVINFSQFVSAVVSTVKGGLLLALHRGVVRYDLESEQMSVLAEPEKDLTDNRFNDGKCDPAGRFWVGTMEVTCRPNRGSLYCLETDGKLTRKLANVTISNGIAWSGDAKVMYYIDTGLNTVRAWDYDVRTGEITNERTCVQYTGAGHLDGMAIDHDGMLWVAVFGEGQVKRYDPRDGREIGFVRLPVSQITSCSFGGEGFRDLYVTSASYEFTNTDWAREPLAGSLFRVRGIGVQGVRLPPFGG
jgi:sugar lactone lactonase YvrE